MTKFGEIISAEEPVLIDFYFDWEDADNNLDTLRDVAAAIGDQGKVIKIETNKNTKLTEALLVKAIPTLMIYKDGEMVWRQSGEQNANTWISLMNDYVG